MRYLKCLFKKRQELESEVDFLDSKAEDLCTRNEEDVEGEEIENTNDEIDEFYDDVSTLDSKYNEAYKDSSDGNPILSQKIDELKEIAENLKNSKQDPDL